MLDLALTGSTVVSASRFRPDGMSGSKEGVSGSPAAREWVDLGQGCILWARAGDVGRKTASGASTIVADGTPARPALGRIDELGVAWAIGRAVRWRSGRLP